MSVFSSFLGGDKNTAGQGAYTQASAALQNVGGVAKTYGNLATTAGAEYGEDDPRYRAASDAEIALLGQNPYTDAYGTAVVANATAGTNDAYQRGVANYVNTDNANGISPDSSVARGQGEALDIARAGTYGNAYNQRAINEVEASRQRAMQITAILGQRAAMSGQRQTSLLGAESGLDESQFQNYENVGDKEYQAEQQRRQNLSAGIGGIANLVGTYFGYGGGTPFGSASGSQPAPTTAQSPYVYNPSTSPNVPGNAAYFGL